MKWTIEKNVILEALNNVTPSDITIYGKTGTGSKTGVAF